MAVQTSYPGVYIDEFAPGAPIEGVGPRTAAFLGPAAMGDLNEPTKITSWDQFRQRFGEQPLPGFFLPPEFTTISMTPRRPGVTSASAPTDRLRPPPWPRGSGRAIGSRSPGAPTGSRWCG